MATLVRVEHQTPPTGLAGAYRLHQSGSYQSGVGATADLPSHDATREQVEDDRQVRPSLVRPDVGDVRGPQTVRAPHFELAAQPILRHAMLTANALLVRMRKAGAWLEAVLLHQAQNQLATDADALVAQFLADPAMTVTASAAIEVMSDSDAQLGVIGLRLWAYAPVVIAAGADTQSLEHRADPVRVPHAFDPGVLLRGNRSRAKYAVAFLEFRSPPVAGPPPSPRLLVGLSPSGPLPGLGPCYELALLN